MLSGGCTSLNEINVDENNTAYASSNGVLFNKEMTVLIKYPEGKNNITEYTVPTGVNIINNSAFLNTSSLTKVLLPEGLTTIGEDAFKNSGITSIEIPEGVTSIRDSAFSKCSSLTSVVLPSTITSIGNKLFYNCSNLTSVNVPAIRLYVYESAY